MSRKAHKEVARKILEDIFNAKDGQFKTKMKTEFVGLSLNEKGGFYSSIINVELTVNHPDGKLVISKDLQLPINLLGDVDVKVDEPKATEETNEPEVKTRKHRTPAE